MAIKTQFLGGGSNLKLKVLVDTGSLVTITCGDIVKTGASVNGVASFSVTAGTWQVKAELNGQESTTEVNVVDEYEVTMSFGKPISSLPLKSKIKVGTLKFILQAIHPTDYPNCYTLIAETSLGQTVYSSGGLNTYNGSNLQQFNEGLYNTLDENVKQCIVPSTCFAEQGNTENQHIFAPSSKQLGLFGSDGGHDLGFNSSADRSTGSQYWTTWFNGGFMMYVIGTAGSPIGKDSRETADSRALTNLSENTIVSGEPDNEGYYVVQGLGG